MGGDEILQQSLKELEKNSSPRVAEFIGWVQNPKAKNYRIPLGILLIIAGVFGAALPLLGVWMIPIGLVLLAFDIPFLKQPVGKLILWAVTKWNHWRAVSARRF